MSAEVQIEVGANDSELRFWLAKEGLRQVELRLSAQASILQALETRANSILTWSVSIGVAVAALATKPAYREAAICAFIAVLSAAIFAVWGLWPRVFFTPGWPYSQMVNQQFSTELEHLEAMAGGGEEGADANDARLRRFALAIRCAWIALILAPVAAALAVAAMGRP